MSVDVIVEATIARPLPVVARFAADPSNAPAWYANIVAVAWRTPPPLALGSRIEFEARFLGRRLVYTYEVVDHVPDQRLVMRTADGPFPMETTYTWAACGANTRMTLRNRGEPAGFARLTGPVLERAVRRATTKDLARLRAVLEGHAGPSASAGGAA